MAHIGRLERCDNALGPAPPKQAASWMGSMTAIAEDDANTARKKFPKHLVEIYDIKNMLGQGSFSTVWRCVHRPTGQIRAVKKIDTSELPPREIAHEIALMKLLRHQNVVRCYDVFLEAQFVNIVIDMFTGGDLIDALNTHRSEWGRIPDSQLAHIARQMTAAITHVHSLCIVHRDIKGENFVLDRPDIGDPECVVALADFGTAKRLDPGTRLTEKVGTPAFWAPEVWKGNYDFLTDVWACGVTVYVLLTGNLPFQGEEDICRPVEPGELSFTPPPYASAGIVAFLKMCLSKDPARRPTASEAQRLPWMDTPVGGPRTKPSFFSQLLGAARTGMAILFGVCDCLSGIAHDLSTNKPIEKKTSSSHREGHDA
eukprot:TRINITY_DN13868_c0_g1_i1.p1 TRINITY_DN13868_c0_g1~~TRINITY_DN13868_c0_g1_i1.p1  ORF type:complete len:371 (-),score=72.91 TRINITY_DN13868_c0_g1_i1:94-1206(-)